MILTVTSPPATMPVTYEQMAAHCRVTTDRERDLMLAYIAQATEYAEQAMEMSLVIRTLTARFHAGEDLRLPRGPVTEIVSVKDDAGSEVTGRHCRVGNSDRVETAYPYGLTVVYKAGYATVPADIVGAIRLHVATLYAWREDKTAAAASTVHKLDDFYAWRGFKQLVA